MPHQRRRTDVTSRRSPSGHDEPRGTLDPTCGEAVVDPEPAAYITYDLSYALLSYPPGALADRVRPPVVYAAGLGCFAAA